MPRGAQIGAEIAHSAIAVVIFASSSG